MTALRRAIAVALIGALSALGLVSCAGAVSRPQAAAAKIAAARCSANRSAGTIRFLSPFFYDASAGILDVYAAQQLGYFRDLCLNVVFDGATTANLYSNVSAGVGTVTGEGSAADVLLGVAGGYRFTAISTFGDTSDYVLLTRSSITNLRQLQGKTLAYHYPVLPVVLSEMLQRAGVNVKKVHTVVDTTYNPTLLIHGPYDALQAYDTNEPLSLTAAGYGKDFRVWTPKEFGVKGTFNVQVVNTAFLKAHPSAVADFLRAELHAFDYCVSHGAQCVGWLAAAAGKSYKVSQSEQEWSLEHQLAIDHSLPGKGVGVETEAEWAPELNALVSAKLLKHAPSLSKVMAPSVAAGLYHGKTLIWP